MTEPLTHELREAWSSEECVDHFLTRMTDGGFYVLVPDNVTRARDERHMPRSAGDITENRPALSRWHPDWAEAFKAFEEG